MNKNTKKNPTKWRFYCGSEVFPRKHRYGPLLVRQGFPNRPVTRDIIRNEIVFKHLEKLSNYNIRCIIVRN